MAFATWIRGYNDACTVDDANVVNSRASNRSENALSRGRHIMYVSIAATMHARLYCKCSQCRYNRLVTSHANAYLLYSGS